MQDKQRFDTVLNLLQQELQRVDKDLNQLVAAADYLEAMLTTRRRRRSRRRRHLYVSNEGTAKSVRLISEDLPQLKAHQCHTGIFERRTSQNRLRILGRKDIPPGRALTSVVKGRMVRTRAIYEALTEFLSSDNNLKWRIERAYESFLKIPTAIVLTVLWLAGIALMGLCTLALYLFWLLLQMAM
jgi:hypothetical protein